MLFNCSSSTVLGKLAMNTLAFLISSPVDPSVRLVERKRTMIIKRLQAKHSLTSHNLHYDLEATWDREVKSSIVTDPERMGKFDSQSQSKEYAVRAKKSTHNCICMSESQHKSHGSNKGAQKKCRTYYMRLLCACVRVAFHWVSRWPWLHLRDVDNWRTRNRKSTR